MGSANTTGRRRTRSRTSANVNAGAALPSPAVMLPSPAPAGPSSCPYPPPREQDDRSLVPAQCMGRPSRPGRAIRPRDPFGRARTPTHRPTTVTFCCCRTGRPSASRPGGRSRSATLAPVTQGPGDEPEAVGRPPEPPRRAWVEWPPQPVTRPFLAAAATPPAATPPPPPVLRRDPV